MIVVLVQLPNMLKGTCALSLSCAAVRALPHKCMAFSQRWLMFCFWARLFFSKVSGFGIVGTYALSLSCAAVRALPHECMTFSQRWLKFRFWARLISSMVVSWKILSIYVWHTQHIFHYTSWQTLNTLKLMALVIVWSPGEASLPDHGLSWSPAPASSEFKF